MIFDIRKMPIPISGDIMRSWRKTTFIILIWGSALSLTLCLSFMFLGYHLQANYVYVIGLVFGFLTPISLVVAIVLNLNYLALAGVRPKDITVNKAYQCEQGQNWTMLLAEIVLLATVTVSGCTWSIDHALGIFCGV